MAIQIVRAGQEQLSHTKTEALDLLQRHRERVLSSTRLRTIAVIAVYDPEESDGDDAATITAADWHCDKGIAPAELVGTLYGLATGVSQSRAND